MSLVELKVKSLTGHTYSVNLQKTVTVLDLKYAIRDQNKSIPPYLQRLLIGSSKDRKEMADEKQLSEYGVETGTTISLMILVPFILYIQGRDEILHTITIPSGDPENYPISQLYSLVKDVVGDELENSQLTYKGKPVYENVEESLTISSFNIKKDSTLILTELGIVIHVSNPLVDVCFLVDCTWSMDKYIIAVKDNIEKLRASLVKEYQSCELQFAFVRYTDYDQSASLRTTYQDFTSNISLFQEFIGKIKAQGGRDAPEDVMGGLKVSLNRLNWRPGASKVLIHITDSPCHGTQYHNFDPSEDHYKDGDPSGLTHEPLMKKIVDLKVQYWFGYIKRERTDKMIEVFNKSLQDQSQKRFLIRQFNAMESTDIAFAMSTSVEDAIYGNAAINQAAAADN